MEWPIGEIMNKCILIGNLTKDPELTTTSNGVAVCRFSIAVSRRYANSDGERETDFLNIVVWRRVCNRPRQLLQPHQQNNWRRISRICS